MQELETSQHKETQEPSHFKRMWLLYVAAAIIVLSIVAGVTIMLNSINEAEEENIPHTPAPEEMQQSLYEALLPYEGRWVGGWTNETFDTSGTMTVDVDVHEDGYVDVTYDLEGYVFGWINPEPRTTRGVYNEEGAFFTVSNDYVFGDVNVHLTPDYTIAISGARIPLTRVDLVEGTGTFSETEASIDYSVRFLRRGGSTGVVTLTKETSEE